MKLTDLTDEVLTRLGENARPLSDLTAVAGIPSLRSRMEMRVKSLLPEAGRTVLLEALPHQLTGGDNIQSISGMEKLPCGQYAASVPLPADFVRLVSVKMKSWTRPATEAVTPDSGGWGRQWAADAGIAGCSTRPMAYISNTPDGLRLTLAGSETAADSLQHCLIWCLPQADSDGNFRFPETMVSSLASLISSKL